MTQQFNADDKYLMHGNDQVGSFITAELARTACDAMNNYSKLRKATESVSQRLSALPDYLKNNDSKVLSEIVDECLDDLINASRSTNQ